jgi:uncharacterized membrane protein
MESKLPEHGITSSMNIGSAERVASLLAGSALVAWGLTRRSRGGLGLAATGGMMVYRGLGGHCFLYQALGITRAKQNGDQVGQLGVVIEREIPVDEQPAKVYAFWRDLRNLPIIMANLESVQVLSERRSRWRAKGPAGTTFEWTAEIINDKPDELIAWRTEPDARIAHAGSVHFVPRPGGGTFIRVALQYDPPGGEVTDLIGRLLGVDPRRRIDEDLERLRDAFARAGQDRDGLSSESADTLGYPAARSKEASRAPAD